jgi:hypothetical protein
MRAQLKMTESVMILIIFLFLLVFGLIVYVRYARSANQETRNEVQGHIAMQISQKVQFLPEVQCTTEGSTDFNCVDVMKLDALKSIDAKQRLIYDKLFPNTVIRISQVYPAEKSWQVYGDEPILKGLYKNTRRYFVPVALYNASIDRYNMGYMEIAVYS